MNTATIDQMQNEISTELEAMRVIGEALSKLGSSESRERVIKWAAERFSIVTDHGTKQHSIASAVTQKEQPSRGDRPSDKKEIPGIATLGANGELKLTVRDLKAKSANDAAIRLVHIALRANQKLTGEESLSSRRALVPLLKSWRVYDGNTRVAISRHKGLVREGDMLSLDYPSQMDADRYMDEILDPETAGSWSPTGKSKGAR